MKVFWKISSLSLAHTPVRIDQNGKTGIILIFVQKNMPANALHCDFFADPTLFVKVIF